MGDDLQELTGVGPATADKLIDAGFDSFEAIAVASQGELSTEADVGDSTAQKVIQSAREEADLGGFESGAVVKKRREQIGEVSLTPAVDELMNGGLHTQSITEVYGEFGAGKSQITHQAVINVQLPPEQGGLGGGAVFIDTEDTFRPERIGDMVRGLDADAQNALMEKYEVDEMEALIEAVLDNIHVAKAFNANHQMLLAEQAEEIGVEHQETETPIRLFTIDSLTAQFRAEYVGRGELAERQQKLNQHLGDIDHLASRFNAIALLTNQVSSNPDSYFGDPTQPIGGNIVAHKSTYRAYIRKSKDDKRIWRLVDAPELADGEAVFKVVNDGIKPESY